METSWGGTCLWADTVMMMICRYRSKIEKSKVIRLITFEGNFPNVCLWSTSSRSSCCLFDSMVAGITSTNHEGGVIITTFSRLLHQHGRLGHSDKIEAYSKEFSAFLERRHVVSNIDPPGQRANAHTSVNDSGTQMSLIMSAEHASPAPGLGTLSSVVMHSPLTTALGSGNSNSSLSPSPTPQSKSADGHSQILTRPRLQDLVREVDATEQLDEEVEELLLQLADDFVESTVNAACIFAKHRHANTVDIKDVQLHLERNWNMSIPGFGTDELRPYKRATVTEAHKQRMALIRKALKKY